MQVILTFGRISLSKFDNLKLIYQSTKRLNFNKCNIMSAITLMHTTVNLQQSRKFAAINNSKAISGAMGNSGISVLLLVYRTLYIK